MASDRILTLTDDNFDDHIQKLAGPVLVDFWAAWCPPCKVIAPALDELADEMAGRATVAKVDIDLNGDVTHRFGIRSIPTLVLFKQGKIVDRLIGSAPKETIRQLLVSHLS